MQLQAPFWRGIQGEKPRGGIVRTHPFGEEWDRILLNIWIFLADTPFSQRKGTWIASPIRNGKGGI